MVSKTERRCIYGLLLGVRGSCPTSGVSAPLPHLLVTLPPQTNAGFTVLLSLELGATVACTEKNLSAQNPSGRLVCFVGWSACCITLELKLVVTGIFKLDGKT